MVGCNAVSGLSIRCTASTTSLEAAGICRTAQLSRCNSFRPGERTAIGRRWSHIEHTLRPQCCQAVGSRFYSSASGEGHRVNIDG